MVPPSSHRVSRVRRYSGFSLDVFSFRLRASPLLWYAFPHISTKIPQFRLAVLTPCVFLHSVWPLPRSLATTCGISFDFSSSPYLDVSVQAVPHIRLFYSPYVDRVLLCRVAPFGYPRIYRLLTAPRGFSQLTASFFGSQCQGIPLALFVT